MRARRRGPTLAAGLLILLVTLAARHVRAFCRTTTCSVTGCAPRDCLKADAATDSACAMACPPARCLAMDANGCLSKGIPLFWGKKCVSFSVEAAGSSRLGLAYADLVPVVQGAFGLWPQAACGGGSPAIAVTSVGALTCDVPEYNGTGPNANGVLFEDAHWPYGMRSSG